MPAAIGRRTFLGLLAVGGAWLVSAPVLPRRWLPGLRRFRIYNVAGTIPRPDPFRLAVIDPAGRQVTAYDLAGLSRVGSAELVRDFHCVTGWSVPGVRWRGVRVRELLEAALGGQSAGFVHFHSADGIYADSLPWDVATRDDVLVAWEMGGQPLPPEHGGPARLVVGPMYGFKSVKWLDRVALSDTDLVGYWEQRGYSPDAWIERPRPPQLHDPQTRRYPEAGVVLQLPRDWVVTDGSPGGITVASATAVPPTSVTVTIYDYRFETKIGADGISRFATPEYLSGSGLSRQTRLAVAGHPAVSVDAVEDIRHVRRTFVAHGHQILLVQQDAPAAEWMGWRETFDAILGALRFSTRAGLPGPGPAR